MRCHLAITFSEGSHPDTAAGCVSRPLKACRVLADTSSWALRSVTLFALGNYAALVALRALPRSLCGAIVCLSLAVSTNSFLCFVDEH
jgi:hypothetical protein